MTSLTGISAVLGAYPKGHPRKWFIDNVGGSGTPFHPVAYHANDSWFKRTNPKGYRHDLGAQDVFLDDAGLLFAEQLGTWSGPVFALIRCQLGGWKLLAGVPVDRRPWWGLYYNAARKMRQGGDPIGLLRFFGQDGCGDSDVDVPGLDGWNPNELFPYPGLENQIREWASPDLQHSMGALPPADWPSVVPDSGIVPSWQATPDLPPNVNTVAAHDRSIDEDRRALSGLVLNQGSTPTCTSHAVATAIRLSVARRHGGLMHLLYRCNPFWLHLRSGSVFSRGRTIRSVVNCVEDLLPPTRETFDPEPFEAAVMPSAPDFEELRTKASDRWGHLEWKALDPRRIDQLKAYLAAGWVIVVATSCSSPVRSRFFMRTGMALRPPPGMPREPGGHAWVLTGYRHVDSHDRTRYQGRFTGLNSWGTGFAPDAPFGPGSVSLPFGFIYSECFEAYACRCR